MIYLKGFLLLTYTMSEILPDSIFNHREEILYIEANVSSQCYSAISQKNIFWPNVIQQYEFLISDSSTTYEPITFKQLTVIRNV